MDWIEWMWMWKVDSGMDVESGKWRGSGSHKRTHPNERRNKRRLSTKWALAATNHLSSHGLCSQSRSCCLRQGGVALGLCIY